jgi:ACS family hexuronate transporter-like MFS transporter
MDRQVISLIEPLLHSLPFMGWDFTKDVVHQSVFNNNYGNIIICFQIAYGVGFLIAGRVIDKLGTRLGYALAIGVWALSSMSHAFVFSVVGFCVARIMLGLGESGNFPAAIKATTEWFPPEERALSTGIFNSGSNAASFIAPALVAGVTMRWGWRAAFVTTGSMGLCWLVLWLFFPYNKLRTKHNREEEAMENADRADLARREAAADQNSGARFKRFFIDYHLTSKHTWAFSIAKGLTDPVWWFYLFYLPKFLHESYNLDLRHAYWQIVTVYAVSSLGSFAGGGLSGWRMKMGHSVNDGRKFALLVCAFAVLPVVFVPHIGQLFPHNSWPAVALIALAAAAHQGWSANLFSTPADMFPSTAVSTVVGIGGAVGAAGGAMFTWVVKHYFSLHPLLIFALAGSAYLLALLIFQLMVPRLGAPRTSPASS